MSELGGNEEGVGGRADSLNFFEVILSSLRENHLGENFFFFYLCPPTPVMCVLGGGSSTGATLGRAGVSLARKSHFAAGEIGNLWKNESGKG